MRKHDAHPDAINGAADLTPERNCIAFGLDRRSFTLDVRADETAVREIALAYHPADGREPFLQRRSLCAFLEAGSGTKSEVKSVVDEMVRNAALAFRPSHPAAPTGWSIHPVAASIIAAAGTVLPNPADPLSWLLRSNGELHLPDGGGIAGAVFHAREGVLLLKRASIVSRRGTVVATMGMDRHKTSIILPERIPRPWWGRSPVGPWEPYATSSPLIGVAPRYQSSPLGASADTSRPRSSRSRTSWPPCFPRRKAVSGGGLGRSGRSSERPLGLRTRTSHTTST